MAVWVGIRAFKKALWCGHLKRQQTPREQSKLQGHLQLRTHIKLNGVSERGREFVLSDIAFWLNQSGDVMMSFVLSSFWLILLSIWTLNSLLWFLEHIQAIYKLIAYKVSGTAMRAMNVCLFALAYLSAHAFENFRNVAFLCPSKRVPPSHVCQGETPGLISPDLVNTHSERHTHPHALVFYWRKCVFLSMLEKKKTDGRRNASNLTIYVQIAAWD